MMLARGLCRQSVRLSALQRLAVPAVSVCLSRHQVSLSASVSTNFSTSSISLLRSGAKTASDLSVAEFDRSTHETLESLCTQFEELVEKYFQNELTDICLTDGVLSISLGTHGYYVINKQTPNRQIWLSSPVSGPKRYDYEAPGSTGAPADWVCRDDGYSLHHLLSLEISEMTGRYIKLSKAGHAQSN